ncbi:MAG: AAA family ATPase [Dermatophilaceae bacterium]
MEIPDRWGPRWDRESPAVALRSAVVLSRCSGYGCRHCPCEGSMALLCSARDTEHITARARGTRLRINFQSPPFCAMLPEGEVMDAVRDGLFHWANVPLGPGAAVRETHSAMVVLLGDRAYKIKKPVDLGFLDFRSVESRREACHRELALNRRMTPDVYIGVADVAGPDGAPCEHVLVMRRMPDESRLARLVCSGVEVRSDLRRLARVVAAFHASAPTDQAITACGSAEALAARWRSNIEGLRELGPMLVTKATLDEIEELALRYIAGREPLLTSRMRAGLVRDGHGDLLAEDIFCLADGPRALDCLDFDERLRWMDVLDDVATLAMDLERLGALQAAQSWLSDYAEFSGVAQPLSLSHHYIAYRAVMRAKVAAIVERGSAQADSAAAAEQTRTLALLGLSHLRAGRVRLILLGGGPATGKSTLAEGLGDEIPAAVLSSDRVRKELSGIPPTQHMPARFGEGIYTPESTSRTYQRLGDQAERLLALGETVVVDASFSTGKQRDLLRSAGQRNAADVIELRCFAPKETLQGRLRSRAVRPAAFSDADSGIAHRMGAATDPWPEAQTIDTQGVPADSLRLALRSLARV